MHRKQERGAFGRLRVRSEGRRRLAPALLAGLLLGSAPLADAVAQAQTATDTPKARPRIGLVLGGGGAKGAAHVGVIKALEEMRIPIDCIAGTSMGSIVGAAYATGLNAEELEKVITGIEWKDILTTAPREQVPYRRKEQDALFTNGLELGIDEGGGGLTFPGGLVPTHQIEAMFKGIVEAAGPTVDFDRLPIPFRAVATDLENGELVLFDHGDLSIAMRASMAVPGAFSPVKYNGRLLVDGMLVRNLPVDVARNTCADVVIAVPVANPRVRLDQLGSALAVTNQAMNVAVEANERTQLATLTDRDVAIPVVLEGIGSADFAKAPEAIPVGEAAARRAAPALARYSLPPEEYARWRASLGKLAAGARPTIDEVRLLGFNRTNADVMRNLIDARPGEPYDPEASTRDATRLVARRDYTSISYDLVPEGDRNVLVYRATEKPWGPRYLKFDLNMSTDGKANTAWGVRGNYEQRWLNALGGEFRADAQLGRPNLLQAEFYQPVDPRLRFFVAPSVQWKQTLEYVYSGDKPISQIDLKRYSLGLDAGVALGTWGEWRIGVQRGHSSIRNKVGDAPLPDEGQFDIGAATMRLSIDTLDQRLFPRQGYFGSLNALVSRTSLGASRDYKLVSGSAGKAFELENGVVTVALRGGTDLNTDAPYYDQFRLGGMFNFSGYTDGQLVGREYGLAGVMYRRRLTYLAESLGTAIYGGATAELGQVYERADGTRVNGLQPAGSIFLGIDSKIGPVYFAYGRAPGGHSAIYLYVGSSFEAFRP